MGEQGNLFGVQNTGESPLAERLRPKRLADLVGQRHFLNERFFKLLQSDRWSGFIFWGPPGTGKTSLARVIAETTRRPFRTLSAVTAGVKDIRTVLEESQRAVGSGLAASILFIDEIHHLNRSQQDVLLPYLESGAIRFIGATTENPSFEINNAIASRSLTFHFQPLKTDEILLVLKKALPPSTAIEPLVLEKMAALSQGDARRAMNLLENIILSTPDDESITIEKFEDLCKAQTLYYDKNADNHYDNISAFIKSIRGSDPDAAVYYLARMLEGGEDPVFVARRLVILASEDIGNANPLGLVLAQSGFSAVHTIGMPEARIILSQVATYLACSEKSNRAYKAIEAAIERVKKTGNLEIPQKFRNTPAAQYRYPHDYPGAWVKEDYLPQEIRSEKFYIPSEYGTERKIGDFLKQRKGGLEEEA